MLIRALLCLLVMPSMVHATVYWSDDFETHLTPNWDTTNCSAGQQQDGCNPVISTTQAYSGTKSLQGNYTTTNCLHPFPVYITCGTYYDRSFQPSTDVYFRFRYKTTGFTYDSTTTKHFYLANGSTYPDVVLKHEYGSREFGMEIEGDGDSCPPTNGPYDSCMYWPNVPPARPTYDDTWYCIEGHVKYNTAGQSDGVLELWVDGYQTMNRTGLSMRGPNASNGGINNSSLATMSYLRVYVQWGSGLMYYDDLAVGNARITCDGTPPAPSDTIPPSQVTGAVATVASSSSILVQHAASTDANGVTGYDYYRCTGAACTTFAVVSTNNALTFTDTGLTASTLYRYKITAKDAAGNISTASSIVEATTAAAGSTTRRQLLSDTITRADSVDLGTGWDAGYTGSSAMKVVSNAIQGSTLSASHLESDNTVTWPADQWAQAQLVTYVNGLSGGGPACRMANPATANGYAIDTSGTNKYVIRKIAAGVYSTIATSTISAASNGVLRLECVGTTQTLYLNDVAIATASDATYATGRAGMMLYVATSLSNTVFDNFVAGDYTASTPPSIASLSVDATGATLTYGATTPTTIRVQIYSPTATLSDVVEPMSAFPSGRYTKTWPQGSESVCFFARDAIGTDNLASADYKCMSLIGYVSQDTTPPVISAGAPTTALAAGTTSTTESWATDEPAYCRRSTTDQAYTAMTQAATTGNGFTHTWAATGLANGTSYTIYVRCTDQYPDTTILHNNLNTTSYSFTYSVAAAGGDITAPSTVAGVSATAISSSQITVTFTAATDNTAVTGYEGHLCVDIACTTSTIINPTWSTATTQSITGLAPSAQYYIGVKAFDAAGNRSAAFSNVVAVTTLAAVDVTPPSNMTGLRVEGTYKNSAVLVWTQGTDNNGSVSAIIEQSPSGCTSWSTVVSQLAQTKLIVSLQPVTTYCFRGRFSDQSGNLSTAWSDTLQVTTGATGLPQPRLTIIVPRIPRS